MKILGGIAAALLGASSATPAAEPTVSLHTEAMPALSTKELAEARSEVLKFYATALESLSVSQTKIDSAPLDPDLLLPSLAPLDGEIVRTVIGAKPSWVERKLGAGDSGLRVVTAGATSKDRELSLAQNTTILTGGVDSSIPTILFSSTGAQVFGGTLATLGLVNDSQLQQVGVAGIPYCPAGITSSFKDLVAIVQNNEAAHVLINSLTIQDSNQMLRRNPYYLPDRIPSDLEDIIKTNFRKRGLSSIAQASADALGELFSDAASINQSMADIGRVLSFATISQQNLPDRYKFSVDFCRLAAKQYLEQTSSERTEAKQNHLMRFLEVGDSSSAEVLREAKLHTLLDELGVAGYEYIRAQYLKFGQAFTSSLAEWNSRQFSN